MPERTVRIPEGVDLHARPAALLVREAAGHAIRVEVVAGNKTADAKSLLQVMALGATGGSDVVVRADDGPGADDAVRAVADLIAGLE